MKSINEYIYEAVTHSDEVIKLKNAKNKIRDKIRVWKSKGKDTTDLEAQLAQAWDAYNAAKEAEKSGASQSSSIPKTHTTPQSTTSSSINASKINTNSSDYKKGYEDAMKRIEEIMKGNNQSSQGSSGSDNGEPDDQLAPLPDEVQQKMKGNPSMDNNQNSNEPRTSKEDENQGVVRPEDCADPTGSLQDMPGTAGGMIDKTDGDKLAESEGYDKEGGSDSNIEKDWKDRAKQAAQKMKGKGAGYDKLAAKLSNINKTSQDWKRELRNIVGHSISPDEKRQAYANKNILISQSRLARTDKDKYDNTDFIMAWIDTSGSMTQDMLEQILTEVYQVALAKKPLTLYIWMYDTRITSQLIYTSVNQLARDLKAGKIQLKGGGGTDCKCCFDELIKNRKFRGRRAELVLNFTDGYLDQYKRNSRSINNLCWCIIDNTMFNLKFKDANTRVIYLDSSKFK